MEVRCQGVAVRIVRPPLFKMAGGTRSAPNDHLVPVQTRYGNVWRKER